MTASGAARTLDVSAFLQGLTFSRYHLRILILCSLVTFFDGQDFSALAYALPYIREDMGLTDTMTGYVSSAAFLGQMLGSLVGSYLGDLWGRRPVIIFCTICSAVFTVLVGFAGSPEQLIALRFISGLAIGGLLAPVWALSIESMPKSMRATSVAIIMLGFSCGSASSAPIANWVAPLLGWQGIFWVCGAMTGVFALILLFTLPESTRWMIARGLPAARVLPGLVRFDARLDQSAYDTLILTDEKGSGSGQSPWQKFRQLFAGKLRWVTPLIWAAYFFSSFAMYLKSAYGVIFMENLGLARTDAAWLGGVTAITGALAGVALLAFTEKRGPGWIAAAPLVAIPFTLLVAFAYFTSGTELAAMLFVSATLVGAGHAAVISITSIYYASSIRSTGGGCASFMAKSAAVAAPIYGAQFLTGIEGALDGYLFTAGCLLGVALCILSLSWFARGLQHGRTSPSMAGS